MFNWFKKLFVGECNCQKGEHCCQKGEECCSHEEKNTDNIMPESGPTSKMPETPVDSNNSGIKTE